MARKENTARRKRKYGRYRDEGRRDKNKARRAAARERQLERRRERRGAAA